nr:MAG TPA: hypothetical protein [Caudoviricetes sp.]
MCCTVIVASITCHLRLVTPLAPAVEQYIYRPPSAVRCADL